MQKKLNLSRLFSVGALNTKRVNMNPFCNLSISNDIFETYENRKMEDEIKINSNDTQKWFNLINNHSKLVLGQSIYNFHVNDLNFKGTEIIPNAYFFI